jgi:hypothetical protein
VTVASVAQTCGGPLVSTGTPHDPHVIFMSTVPSHHTRSIEQKVVADRGTDTSSRWWSSS